MTNFHFLFIELKALNILYNIRAKSFVHNLGVIQISSH